MLLLLKYTKTVLKNAILPPISSLLLLLAGIVLLRRRPRLARALLILGFGSLWLLSTPLIADGLSALAEHYPALRLEDAAGAQAIVVLGGGGQRAFAPEYGGPAAEPYLLERLAYGAYLQRRLGLPILVTGFHIEANAMHDTLERNFNIQARWVDDQSYDTFENARNSARLLRADGINRIVLVTRGTHMWRSVHEFTATGLSVVPAPVGVLAPRATLIFRFLPEADALYRSYMAIYELVGEPVRLLLWLTHLRRHGS